MQEQYRLEVTTMICENHNIDDLVEITIKSVDVMFDTEGFVISYDIMDFEDEIMLTDGVELQYELDEDGNQYEFSVDDYVEDEYYLTYDEAKESYDLYIENYKNMNK